VVRRTGRGHRGGSAVRRGVRPVGPAHGAAQNPRGLGARDVGKARGGLGKARVGADAEAAGAARRWRALVPTFQSASV
jgi:hypothetical protein